MNTKPASVCAYCGATSPMTRDHIPPKGIFPAPRPSDLITVPSCASCNQAASESDECFVRTCRCTLASIHRPLDAFGSKRALPRIRRRRRLRDQYCERVRTCVAYYAGRCDPRARVSNARDSDAHDKTIERLIRGLYFHHYKEVLGQRVRVKAQWFRGLTQALLEATSDCEQRFVGNGQFAYRFGRAVDGRSIQFGCLSFTGATGPAARPLRRLMRLMTQVLANQ